MSKLLEVASQPAGDSQWTAGLTVENLQCSLQSGIAGLCLPAPTGLTVTEGEPSGYALSPFSVIVRMRQSNLCHGSDPRQVVDSRLEAEKEKAAGRALWYGTGNASMWLGASGVTSLSSSFGVGEALKAFYDATVGVEPIIHMGLKKAATQTGLNKDGRFKAFPDVPVVVNPSYPEDAMAITGPIDIYFASPETIQVYDVRINRNDTAADMFGAVAFDPCEAFVLGELPDQVYAGVDEDGEVTVYVFDADDNATVDFGDQQQYTVTNKALTSNVATLTIGTHTLLVGQTVTVAGVDSVFNGTYTITAVAATTISYAKTNANVTSASASGTVTRNGSQTILAGSTTGLTHTYDSAGTYTVTVTHNSGTTTYSVTV